MKLVVGLGNPGRKYEGSRHNIGCVAVKAYAAEYGATFRRSLRFSSLISRVGDGPQGLILALPQTCMNASGVAVASLVRAYKVAPEELLVMCDDMDLALGRLRLRKRGSSGGHNGLSSIIAELGTTEFSRLRLGIDRPSPAGIEPAEYVLSAFRRSELTQVQAMIASATMAISTWRAHRIDKAMNIVNQRSIEDE